MQTISGFGKAWGEKTSLLASLGPATPRRRSGCLCTCKVSTEQRVNIEVSAASQRVKIQA